MAFTIFLVASVGTRCTKGEKQRMVSHHAIVSDVRYDSELWKRYADD